MNEETEELDFGLQDSEGEEEDVKVEHKHTPKKVEITISERGIDGELNTFTCTDERLGKHYVSVNMSAGNYGSGSPCQTEAEIKASVEHAREWCLKEGDIPIIRDLRDRCKLTRWMK